MGRLTIRRLGYALGAEIVDVDLARDLDDDVIAEIRAAWLENILLCFRGAVLDPERFSAFCGRFGTLDDNRAIPDRRHPDRPAVAVLANKPITVGGTSFGKVSASTWHSDLSGSPRPTTATFLNAQVLPQVGGDTMFANMYLAYEALSPAFKGTIDDLEGVHDVTLTAKLEQTTAEVRRERLLRNPPIVHPIVRLHPETGRKALFVGSRVRNFAGMSEEESKPLLEFLNRHATSYEFVYRHRWAPGDLLMWDNRSALHYAVPDYDAAALRKMQRCSLLAPKSGYVYAGDPAPV